MSSLGDRLKSAREDRGLSQAELSKAVGAQPSSINDIESGRVKTSTYLLKIANHLNVDPNWLETGSGSIRGVGVQIVNQGAALPLFDWDTILECALEDNFNKPVLDMLYRCPVKHSDKAFTTLLTRERESFACNSILFVDPAGIYKNGDYVLAAFPDSKMLDVCMLVSNGMTTFVKSLDPALDSGTRNTEVRLSTVGGGQIDLPVTTKKSVPKVILTGRIFFEGRIIH